MHQLGYVDEVEIIYILDTRPLVGIDHVLADSPGTGLMKRRYSVSLSGSDPIVDAPVAHLVRTLQAHRYNHAIPQELNHLRQIILAHDEHLTLLARFHDGPRRADRSRRVGTVDALQVRMCVEQAGGQVHRTLQVVVVRLFGHHFHVGILGNDFLEANNPLPVLDRARAADENRYFAFVIQLLGQRLSHTTTVWLIRRVPNEAQPIGIGTVVVERHYRDTEFRRLIKQRRVGCRVEARSKQDIRLLGRSSLQTLSVDHHIAVRRRIPLKLHLDTRLLYLGDGVLNPHLEVFVPRMHQLGYVDKVEFFFRGLRL